ncbi:type II toxin-antitoxin system Phd/YefM family antitoxin [bacterium]|nr:type II toxin-antitoxin system Phd/YefM family antitoxin [bacterium]
MKTITFTEFRKNASGLFNEVEHGETLMIIRHGKTIAKISPPSMNDFRTPSWKRSALKLTLKGKSLSNIIIDDREVS